MRALSTKHAKIIEAEPGPARYLVAGEFLPWRELAATLEAASGSKLRKVPFPAPLLRATGRFLELVRKVVPVELPLNSEAAAYVTRWDPVPNSASLAEMGVRFRDVHDSIQETVHWMQKTGHLSQ